MGQDGVLDMKDTILRAQGCLLIADPDKELLVERTHVA
jgi:hypothetical protein